MLLLITKSQGFLFDAPVPVAGSVRKDGTVVKPHVRVQRIALKPHAHQASLFEEPTHVEKPKRTRLDAFIERKGGAAAMAHIIVQLTPEQQEKILAEMGKLAGGKTAAEVRAMLPKAAEAKPAQADLFSQPEPVAEKKEEPKPEPKAAEEIGLSGFPCGTYGVCL